MSLLTVLPIFLQIIPFSIIAFEMERWLVQGSDDNKDQSQTGLEGALNSTSVAIVDHSDQISIPMLPLPRSSTIGHTGGMLEGEIQSEFEAYHPESDGGYDSVRSARGARSSCGSLDEDEVRLNVASWVSAARGGEQMDQLDDPLMWREANDPSDTDRMLSGYGVDPKRGIGTKRACEVTLGVNASGEKARYSASGGLEVQDPQPSTRISTGLESLPVNAPQASARRRHRAPSVTIALLTRPRWHQAYLRMHRDYTHGSSLSRYMSVVISLVTYPRHPLCCAPCM